MLWERQRAVMGPGAGATAHWVAAGGATKVRSSHRTSNSVPFRLILTICLPLLLSLCASGSLAGGSRLPQGAREGRHRRSRGSPEPWGLRRCRLRPGQTSSSIPWPPRRALEELSGECMVVTVVWLAVQCVTGPRRPRLGVQRPGPGPAVAHGYPGARRCASSAVRFAWCLARSPIWGF